MKQTAHPRLFVFLPVLLALLLSSAACALPFGGSPATPTAVLDIPTQVNPTFTLAPTQAPPSLPAPTQAPANTQPALTQAPANTQPPPPPATATRQPQAPTPIRTPRGLSEVTIYFVAVGDNGQSGPKIGCGDSLVAVKQPIEPTTGVIRAALNKLFSYKQQDIGESGLYNALWQSNLTLASARVDDGVATVNLTGQPQMGGECDTPRFIGQIRQTILAQQGVKAANVFLNGKPIEQALSLR